jgi:VanZ family protein
MIGKILRRGFALAMLTGIFLLSNQPSLDILPPLFPMQDKVLHTGEFFLLGISLLLNRDLCARRRYSVLIVFAFGALWGGLDEIHQSFIPGRDCSLGDFAADVVGLSLAMTLRQLRLRRRRETHQERLTTEGING